MNSDELLARILRTTHCTSAGNHFLLYEFSVCMSNFSGENSTILILINTTYLGV